MNFDLGLGFQKSAAARFAASYFLDPFRFKGTYSGGDNLTFFDWQGKLQSANGVTGPIVEGARLATTVAEGAELGPELVTNGDFLSWSGDVPVGWSFVAPEPNVATESDADGNPTTGGGHVKLLSTDGTFIHVDQTNNREVGKRYQTTIKVTKVYGNGLKFTSDWATAGNIPLQSPGVYVFETVAASAGIAVGRYATAGDGGVIESISVREVIPTLVVTSTSGLPLHPYVTRRDKQGSKRVFIRYPERQDSTVYSVGDKCSFAGVTVGDEVLTDPEFSSPIGVDWDTAANWTISNGVATHTPGATNSLYTVAPQANVGDKYVITVKVFGATSGYIRIQAGGNIDSAQITSGIYAASLEFTANGKIWLIPSADFDGSIEFCSCKPLLSTTTLYGEVVASTGPTDSALPTISDADIGQTVTDGGVVWQVKGYHTIKGLANWAGATNLVPDSTGLTPMLQIRSSLISDATVAPDDSTTAFKLSSDTSTAATHYLRYAVGDGVSTYTLSCFAKKAELTKVAISNNIGTAYDCIFDLDAGVVESVGNYADGAEIEPVGDGWYRCSATITGAIRIDIGLCNPTPVYDGDGVSGVYIWGPQVETGSVATPLIPTSGATATRTATNTSDDGTKWREQIKLTVTPAASATAGILLDDGTNSLSYDGTNLTFTDGTTTLTAAVALNAGTTYDIGLDTTPGAWRLLVDGSVVDTDATGGAVSWANPSYIGRDAGGTSIFNGHISGLVSDRQGVL